MIRMVSMSYIALVAGLVFSLYHVKYETQDLEQQKREMERQIIKSRAEIEVLEAEWAARTSPDYIARLVADHLPALRPSEPHQLAALSKVPLRSTPRTAPGSDGIEELLSMVELRPAEAPLESTPRPRPAL